MKFRWLNTFLLLTLFAVSAHAQVKNDTFSVYFDLDVSELSGKAKGDLDLLLYQNRIPAGVPVSIIGYADFLNTDEYNLLLSRKRAENVKAYLIQSGLDTSFIKLLVGRGEIRRKDTLGKHRGVPEDRRVDLVIEYGKPARAIPENTVIHMQPSLKKEIPPSTSDEDFDIQNVPKGRTFILQNIYFPMSRHFPRQSSYHDLDMLLEALRDNKNMRIRIEGHVCCVRNVADAYDLDSRQLDLSVNRARFIYEYLKARGVDSSRLEYAGYGRSRPIIEDEQNEEEAAVNRRVEIRILEK